MSTHSGPSTNQVRGRAAKTIQLAEDAKRILTASRWPLTVRQLYYRLVGEGSIPKTVASYRALVRLVVRLREEGEIPWTRIVDNTRAILQPAVHDGLEELLRSTAKLYRSDLMAQQPVAIQVWAESDSIGSVIGMATDPYAVPVFIGRGYASRGYLWTAAADAVAAYRAGKDVHLLHVGDYDPSGLDIFRDVEATLRLYAAAIDTDATASENPRMH